MNEIAWKGERISMANTQNGRSWKLPWDSPNVGASNSSGFSALPSGMIFYNMVSTNMGDYAVWWTSSTSVPDYAWYRLISAGSDQIYRTNGGYKLNTTPARCVKD